MSDKSILKELVETLSEVIQQEYVETYCTDKEKGLTKKFDKLIEESIHET